VTNSRWELATVLLVAATGFWLGWHFVALKVNQRAKGVARRRKT
jgi:hypothetical protein